ncbi:DUF2975 domain-containing protein [Luteibacter pinisoli]|uniref:DUF2975 domain-containing protein n=1 Tax=Luteibacter pinisoli TaxID=2589080 RepID=A0A4Y5YY34_9GAMM|nr:DUF2975 domain-containing protein [Luteibacter pinisoli]QDE37734.1 DUF2975 domain-containing protein [Luteibacter pinisoli]
MKTQLLQRRARRLRRATCASGALLALMVVSGIALPDNGIIRVSGAELPYVWNVITSSAVVLLAVLSLVALAAMLRAVEAGELFARSTTQRFRRFALLYLLSIVADLLLPPMVQLGLLLAHGGHGLVTVGIDNARVLSLAVAGILFFIARLFDEAQRLEEDSRGIV